MPRQNFACIIKVWLFPVDVPNNTHDQLQCRPLLFQMHDGLGRNANVLVSESASPKLFLFQNILLIHSGRQQICPDALYKVSTTYFTRGSTRCSIKMFHDTARKETPQPETNMRTNACTHTRRRTYTCSTHANKQGHLSTRHQPQ